MHGNVRSQSLTVIEMLCGGGVRFTNVEVICGDLARRMPYFDWLFKRIFR